MLHIRHVEPRESGPMPEAVLVADIPGKSRGVIGFAEVSRRAYAEGCESSPGINDGRSLARK